MRVLSLFSGGGLGDYGLELAGMEIVGQVEIDDYCQKILKLRWPDVPKWGDIKLVTGKEIIEKCGTVDLISGGFPCQPYSSAGRRTGKEDSRYLWPEMFRIICEVRPRWVLAENVPGLLSISNGRVFGEVVRDLAESGYCVGWNCIPASAVGAPHRRDRVWILAYTDAPWKRGKQRKEKINKNTSLPNPGLLGSSKHEKQATGTKQFCQTLADSKAVYVQGQHYKQEQREPRRSSWWSVEPNVGRVAHGVSNWVDRLKLLGNGQVVQVVEWIGKRIIEFQRIEK